MNKKERKEEALKLKGNHKIYYCPEEDHQEYGIENAAEVADLSECERPEEHGDRWTIPDFTPDWLYEILDLYGGVELMESIFTFPDKQTMKEFEEICDVVL